MMIHTDPALWRGAEFRKSSYSGGENGNCVELAWRKSTFSGSNGGECVELARTPVVFGIRDSKNTSGPVLTVPGDRAATFLAAIRHA
ncbi:uncharacterized protein DUF397 [Herbihabitans rhizosphaerae]|uniref:Uncharacterized protein DUF397 n=1 Tax=Herbihabitans rhizosphaerae TaxID=1872711 RepID=A0A4Q7L756_9PSEU|nr:DUF397 domain-containing protein [Herbihabitans rhizosphaerae]RZS44710.1 uncharacterized protein DUF397 [Herbihabitans rhizosphaerae]